MPFRFVKIRKKRRISATSAEILDRLERYMDEHEAEPIRILVSCWRDQQTAITYREIRDAILDEGIEYTDLEREWTSDYSRFVAEKMAPVWREAMRGGAFGQPAMDSKQDLFRFDINSPQLAQWIDDRGAAFVTAVTQDQKQAMQALIRQYMYGQYGYEELARVIRPCIGLTEGGSRAVLRYYENMKETMREQHPRMKQSSIEEKCLKKTMRYAEHQHRERAKTIARTEMAFAYNQGMHESMRQAQEQNLMGVMEKRWVTSSNENVCERCEALNGKQIGFDVPFDFGKHRHLFDGQELAPPAHPRCACVVQYIETAPPVYAQQEAPIDNEFTNPAVPDYLVENYEQGSNITSERLNIIKAISSSPQKVQDAINNGTRIVVGKYSASRYDYANDILYIAKGADAEEVAHEIGHLVDKKLVSEGLRDQLIKKTFSTVSVMDVRNSLFTDASGIEHEVMYVKSRQLVSDYQGRLYVENVFDAFNSDGTIKPEKVKEFVSEIYREYWLNPTRLSQDFPDFYSFIVGAIQ